MSPPDVDVCAHLDGDHAQVWQLDRPYADVPTDALVDSLEAQDERDEPLNRDIVFELAARLIHAEGLGVIAPAG